MGVRRRLPSTVGSNGALYAWKCNKESSPRCENCTEASVDSDSDGEGGSKEVPYYKSVWMKTPQSDPFELVSEEICEEWGTLKARRLEGYEKNFQDWFTELPETRQDREVWLEEWR